METSAVLPQARRSVRWPFRALAALIFLAILSVASGWSLMAWHGHLSPVEVRGLVVAPGFLWLLRLTYHAACFGRSPPISAWSFASDRIMFLYLVLAFVVLRA